MKKTKIFYDRQRVHLDEQINEFLDNNGVELDQMIFVNEGVLISYTAPPEKKKKEKKEFVPPTREEMAEYAFQNGYYRSCGHNAFDYYHKLGWKDAKDNPVKNWKAKMLSVWMKDEHKLPAPPPSNLEVSLSIFPKEYSDYVAAMKAAGMNFMSFEEWKGKNG